MGGLLIAGYLANCKSNSREPRVNRVATLATPFQGSYDAITKIAIGKGNLGSGAPSPRERRAARLTPSLYHLLPSFEGALQIEDGCPLNAESWFDSTVWQPSVTRSIAEYIDTHALDPGDEGAQQGAAAKLFQNFLDDGATHRTKIDSLKLDEVGMKQNQWLCIVGVDEYTRVTLPIGKDEDDRPVFFFRRRDRKNQWIANDANDRYLTGDGTVPLKGAIPNFLDKESLVCVKPEDFRGEIGDSFLFWLTGFHGMMPNMNLVQRLIVRHFTQRNEKYNSSWGRGLPGIQGENWTPPIVKLEERL